MHHHCLRIGADNAGDFVSGRDGHVPPTFCPGANSTRRPGFAILRKQGKRLPRHRPQAMRDQVNSLAENGKLKPPLEKVVRQWLRSGVN